MEQYYLSFREVGSIKFGKKKKKPKLQFESNHQGFQNIIGAGKRVPLFCPTHYLLFNLEMKEKNILLCGPGPFSGEK